jgi:HSP20 family protein
MAEKSKGRELEGREWTPLRTWSPFRDFGSGLGRIFDEMFSERGMPVARWMPAVDVAENDHAYVVTVELPGAKREDVNLEVHENVLSIRGEKKSEREERSEKRHFVERMYGSFSRSFTLPANADAEHVKATFRDGVLTIEVPKTEEAKPKTIDIKAT